MKIIGIAGIIGIVFLSLVSINLVQQKPDPEKMRDGRYLRVVSLAPSMSETMVALGQEHRVVGVTIHCHNQALSHAEKIGSFAEPNVEAILALHPDLVLAVPHVMAKNTLHQIEAHNIEVFAHQPNTLSDIKYINAAIASKLNIKDKGIALNQAIDRAIDQAKQTIFSIQTGHDTKTVLIAVSHTPFVVAGINTFASQIIEILGFTNMADDPHIPWPVWPLEHLLSKPPDILIVADGQENFSGYKKMFEALGLDMSKAGIRLIIPKRPLFNSPSPALMDDALYLSRLLTGWPRFARHDDIL